MHRFTITRALQVLLAASAFSAHIAAAQAPQSEGARAESVGPFRQLTSTEAQADFDVLRRALEEAHGALYRFSTKAELDRRFDGYRARLDRPLTQLAFIGVISGMLAEIRDGHTRLEYDSATTAALAGARLFPLRVVVEGSRLVVVSNDTPGDSTIRPGMEIVSINDRPAGEIVAQILPNLSGDGFIETGKKMGLRRGFARSYWLFVDQTAEFRIVARDPGGRTIAATLTGVLDAERSANLNPVNAQIRANEVRLDGSKENVSLRFVGDSGIAHLRIRGFEADDYPMAIAAAFRTLHDRVTKALILDLRGNGGGVDEYGALLVSHLTDKPFRYFDRIHLATIRPSFATWKPSTFDDIRDGVVPDPAGGYLVTARLHSGVAEQPPATSPFLGRLIVLMDGGTFSTSADVTATLHHLKRATFVGTETAGAYEGNTSGLNALIVLPNSRLRQKVQMYGYVNAVNADAKGRGTRPDYPVERRVADVLQGIDAQLERAVAIARVF